MNARASMVALAAILVIGTTSPLDAQTPSVAPPPDGQSAVEGADFWRSVAYPDNHRVQALLTQAQHMLRVAQRQLPTSWEVMCQRTHGLPTPADLPAVWDGRARALRQWLRQALRRQALLERAIARLEEAHSIVPTEPLVLHTLATAHLAWEQPASIWHCGTYHQDGEALTLLHQLRALDPEYEADRVANQLGNIYTRRHEFPLAAREFARALTLSLDRQQHALSRYNLAEVTMLSGRLTAALYHYERAAVTAVEPQTHALALWGLAVARDRADDHEAALETAMQALNASGGSMHVLRSDGVFFEPAHEIHYYEALGHEAKAQLEPAQVVEHLDSARQAWHRYLQAAPADDRWIEQARAHWSQLNARAAQGPN